MKDFEKDNKLIRICYVCRKELELNSSNFYKNSTKSNGYELCCKQCSKHRLSKYYSNIDNDKKEIKNIKTKEWRDAQYEKGLCRFCKEPHLKNSKTCEKHYLQDLSRRHLGTTTKWEDLRHLLEKQNYKCIYSGDELILSDNASIDHILPLSENPDLNCDIDNLQWITRQINLIKLNLSEEDFLNIIKKIYEFKIKKGGSY